MIFYIILSLVVYILGMAWFYGLCYYLFGKPDGRECEWWSNRKDAQGFALVFWPLVMPFTAARLIGFKKRMALLQPEPKKISYSVGDWKGNK